MWEEGEAGREAQEVGSCNICIGINVRRLILWSDSCGGQNRNIMLVLMLKAALTEHNSIEEIHIRFLESGHSFLPNDSDFAKIECSLKRQDRVYTPNDYIRIMKNCKRNNPLKVHIMKTTDFLSTATLEKKNTTNRKKNRRWQTSFMAYYKGNNDKEGRNL